MLSGYPVKDSKFKNYQHSLFSHPEIKDFHYDNLDMFELSKDIMEFSDTLIKVQSFYYEHIFDEEVVELLYKRRNEFDLFIFDRVMNEVRCLMKNKYTYIVISFDCLGKWMINFSTKRYHDITNLILIGTIQECLDKWKCEFPIHQSDASVKNFSITMYQSIKSNTLTAIFYII